LIRWLLVKKLKKRIRLEFLLSLTQLSASGGNLFEQLLEFVRTWGMPDFKNKTDPQPQALVLPALNAATDVMGKHVKELQSCRQVEMHRSWKIKFLSQRLAPFLLLYRNYNIIFMFDKKCYPAGPSSHFEYHLVHE
jgi:hypothetical protein